jgi:hypothetical protein
MIRNRRKLNSLVIATLCVSTLLTGCSSSTSEDATAFLDDSINSFLGDSANVNSVKNAYLSSCPNATLGQMADAFLGSPSWTDFDSTSVGTVVELTGGMTYDGADVEALIQFELSGSSFEASYLSFNQVSQNQLMLSSLLTKMCDAA